MKFRWRNDSIYDGPSLWFETEIKAIKNAVWNACRAKKQVPNDEQARAVWRSMRANGYSIETNDH